MNASTGDRVAVCQDGKEIRRGEVLAITSEWGREGVVIDADGLDLDVTVWERGDREIRLLCEQCDDYRPPGGSLCPACDDMRRAAVFREYPPGDPSGAGRVPPHGNTTR